MKNKEIKKQEKQKCKKSSMNSKRMRARYERENKHRSSRVACLKNE